MNDGNGGRKNQVTPPPHLERWGSKNRMPGYPTYIMDYPHLERWGRKNRILVTPPFKVGNDKDRKSIRT
jgi:hypothetical protein